jgi:hypothetical protein
VHYLGVTELNAAGSGLNYSTYLGAVNVMPYSVTTDLTGAFYVAGYAGQGLLTTPGALQTSLSLYAVSGGYIAKFSAGGIAFSKGFSQSAGSVQSNDAAGLEGSRLRLTDRQNYETASAFYNQPINIQKFTLTALSK